MLKGKPKTTVIFAFVVMTLCWIFFWPVRAQEEPTQPPFDNVISTSIAATLTATHATPNVPTSTPTLPPTPTRYTEIELQTAIAGTIAAFTQVPTATITPTPTVPIVCNGEQLGPFLERLEGYDEILIEVPQNSNAYHTVSFWWQERLSFSETAIVRRVNAPTGSGETEIVFLVPPTIETIGFRTPEGGNAWRLCNLTLEQARADADGYARRRSEDNPTVLYWRIDLPEALQDANVAQLISCISPSVNGVPACPGPGPVEVSSWIVDHANRIVRWNGHVDGREDVWQGSDEILELVRAGYTAVFGPMDVPGEIFACDLVINGEERKNSCDGENVLVPAGVEFQITSEGAVGGFRWCPLDGHGYRNNTQIECR